MDNSQFSSFFWGLTDENSNEHIVNSAESIVNLVYTKQMFENKQQNEINKDKYKIYLNLLPKPSEDILYTMRRLVRIPSNITILLNINRWVDCLQLV